MRSLQLVIALLMLSLLSGCYPGITGRVIDAETQQPIEGAVVLAEWTKTKGYGLTYTESYKVVEAVSDKEGKVKIEGCVCLFTNPPDVTVYTKGYVAWSSAIIFPDYRKRSEFIWSSQTFRLEQFRTEYSYVDHTMFIGSAIHDNLGIANKKLIIDASRWENEKASKERDNSRGGQ